MVTISIVKISDDLVAKVAERAGTTEQDIRDYISTDRQDNNLFRAFEYYQIFPFKKFPR